MSSQSYNMGYETDQFLSNIGIIVPEYPTTHAAEEASAQYVNEELIRLGEQEAERTQSEERRLYDEWWCRIEDEDQQAREKMDPANLQMVPYGYNYSSEPINPILYFMMGGGTYNFVMDNNLIPDVVLGNSNNPVTTSIDFNNIAISYHNAYEHSLVPISDNTHVSVIDNNTADGAMALSDQYITYAFVINGQSLGQFSSILNNLNDNLGNVVDLNNMLSNDNPLGGGDTLYYGYLYINVPEGRITGTVYSFTPQNNEFGSTLQDICPILEEHEFNISNIPMVSAVLLPINTDIPVVPQPLENEENSNTPLITIDNSNIECDNKDMCCFII